MKLSLYIMRKLIKNAPNVNGGTMADVAFLLLIFFLVSSTIHNDYGISSTISKAFAVPDSVTIVQTNLLLNRYGELMLENNEVDFEDLSEEIASNFDKRKAIKNVLVLKTEREVEYSFFIQAL
ncbi:MAG: biopolymer transporter ExbD, partial [Bacteroidia bacterium]|nr:biopolymer transporter ExbD [Bacteroidia bacterium]